MLSGMAHEPNCCAVLIRKCGGRVLSDAPGMCALSRSARGVTALDPPALRWGVVPAGELPPPVGCGGAIWRVQGIRVWARARGGCAAPLHPGEWSPPRLHGGWPPRLASCAAWWPGCSVVVGWLLNSSTATKHGSQVERVQAVNRLATPSQVLFLACTCRQRRCTCLCPRRRAGRSCEAGPGGLLERCV